MSGKAKRRKGASFAIPANQVLTRRSRVIATLVLAFLAAISSAQAAGADPAPLPCIGGRCGLVADGAYPNLVIGRLDYAGTPADMTEVYHWARTHGYWKDLPASIEPYLRDVKLVTIALPKRMASQPVTLFMLQSEYAAAPYHLGDLVRYAPHDAAHDETAKGSPDDLALFHRLTGCLATLCQKGDSACFARYRQGAFTTTHGQAVSLETGRLIPAGQRIDPVSLLPVH